MTSATALRDVSGPAPAFAELQHGSCSCVLGRARVSAVAYDMCGVPWLHVRDEWGLFSYVLEGGAMTKPGSGASGDETQGGPGGGLELLMDLGAVWGRAAWAYTCVTWHVQPPATS